MGHTEPTASVSEFVADPDAHLRRLATEGFEMLTVEGRRTAALVPAEEWDRIQDELERTALVAKLRKSLAQADAGELIPLDEVRERFRQKHGF